MKKLSILILLGISHLGYSQSTVTLLNKAVNLDTNDPSYLIQAGSFKSESNARRYQYRLQHMTKYPVLVNHNRYYKVIVGPIDTARKTRKEARDIMAQLHPAYKAGMAVPSLLYYDNRHWYGTIGGGGQWSSLKSSMTVPNGSDFPAPQNVDLFSVKNGSTSGIFFLSAGHRWERDDDWFSAYSLGIYYQYLFNQNIMGTIEQYSEPQFLNYAYQWGGSSSVVLLSGKLNVYQLDKWSPYVALGLGVALNQTASYSETAYAGVTPRDNPDYSSGTTSNFAYQLGVGIDYQATQAWILSLGYVYQNIGNMQSGPGVSTWSSTYLNLGSWSQSEVAASVTYLF